MLNIVLIFRDVQKNLLNNYSQNAIISINKAVISKRLSRCLNGTSDVPVSMI